MNEVIIVYKTPRITEKGQFSKISLSLANDNTCKFEVDNSFFENIYNYTKETTSSAFEFYLFCVLIYNIDKLIPRKKFSLDGWCREITFKFKVRDLAIWNEQKDEICNMLAFLTGDVWNVDFIQDQNSNHFMPLDSNNVNGFIPEKVCLFSGGLDSLVGVYDLLQSNKKTLLVSHFDYDMKSAHTDQNNIINKIRTKFNQNERFDWVYNRVGAEQGYSNKLETTFRSRSILFLGMASYLAHNLTPNTTFYIPENGTISLNIPLSPSRRSSCSTKTTHPHVLLSLNKIFIGLGINTSVENPFEFKTKGEMLQPFSSDLFFKSLVDSSNSCGKGGHRRWWYYYISKLDILPKPSHCGKCMPCIYRRAAMNKVLWDDKVFYGDNIFDKLHWDTLNTKKHKRFKDVKTLLQFIAQDKSREQIKKELLINGSLPLEKLNAYEDVVVRTIAEIKSWLNAHSTDSNYNILKRRAKL